MPDSIQRYSRKGLQTIINVLPMAVMVLDKTLTAILTNSAALRFTRKNMDQVIGQTGGGALGCLNAAPQGCGLGLKCVACTLREALLDTLKRKTPRTTIETAMDLEKNGTRILRFSTLPLKLDRQQAILLTIEDLTDARFHEQEHLEKEKLTAVLETIGGVCHELSQPLQVIMGYCDILKGHREVEPEIAQALAAVGMEINRLAQLVHNLTHVTRYETKPYLKSKIIDIQKSSAESDPAPNV